MKNIHFTSFFIHPSYATVNIFLCERWDISLDVIHYLLRCKYTVDGIEIKLVLHFACIVFKTNYSSKWEVS